jgi:hypothetical protein
MVNAVVGGEPGKTRSPCCLTFPVLSEYVRGGCVVLGATSLKSQRVAKPSVARPPGYELTGRVLPAWWGLECAGRWPLRRSQVWRFVWTNFVVFVALGGIGQSNIAVPTQVCRWSSGRARHCPSDHG